MQSSEEETGFDSLRTLNDSRRLQGLPLYALVTDRREVEQQTWRFVRCPWCGALHCHVAKRSGTTMKAPCSNGSSDRRYTIYERAAKSRA